MKWIWSMALFAAGCAVLNAQDAKPPKMADTAKATYTGCVEAVNNGGEFVLTHVEETHRMSMPASAHNPADQMMSHVVTLTGRSSLKKHVGQKVMVAGSLSHGMPDAAPNRRDILALTSLKVVMRSCS
jgi:hypothetical protein